MTDFFAYMDKDVELWRKRYSWEQAAGRRWQHYLDDLSAFFAFLDKTGVLATRMTREQGIDLDPREGFRRAAHAAVHGLTTSMSISSKSLTLRVATAMPRERAIAAIWQSAGGSVRPTERRMAAISA